jgi:CheY-like chemotaxis protein/anti-sigma regulatory factor (Ser/Thr protein kinase)
LFVSLLDISRLDAGAVRPYIEEFRVEPLLRLVEMNSLPRALVRNLKLRVVHSRAVVRSDPALLERILGNLVSNAIRYTVHGRILVGCRRRGDQLRILVIDTGVGVPETLHKDIFEEFYQVVKPDRDRSEGLGLGLSIVKRTAQILGHALIVKSVVGRGSTFGVEVPLIARPLLPAPAPSVSAIDSARFAGAFVLVIDDDRENRFALEALCRQWGCNVVGAASASQAVQTLKDHLRSPDLIICDFRPSYGETAVSAIALVRHHIEESVPAVVVTGDTSMRALQGVIDPIALLHKPINAERLRLAAGRLLAAPATPGH